MKKVLVLGAGLVARPLIRYFLDRNYYVTVATRTISKAQQLVNNHENSAVEVLDLKKPKMLDPLIEKADLVISLVPYTFHVVVAEKCIAHKKNMVTTSYISPAMKELESKAIAAGITILNEIGLDPGIDHMSAMKIIHGVERQNGRIISFRSLCGGLPAPEANDNPFGYKFSWSPKGVVMAGRNSAQYLKNGEVIKIDGKDLFTHHFPISIPEGGDFEFYPNRDSLSYIDIYGLEGVRTMFRGTLRNPGWCSAWAAIGKLGFLQDKNRDDLANMTLGKFTESVTGVKFGNRQRALVAAKLEIDEDDPIMEKLAWLGLFSKKKLLVQEGSNLDILAAHLLEKMAYKKGERDMVVLYHEFEAEYQDGRIDKIESILVDYGVPGGDSSMARTVSYPAAIGSRLILEGTIKRKGILSPIHPEIYEPVLNELEGLGVNFQEIITQKSAGRSEVITGHEDSDYAFR